MGEGGLVGPLTPDRFIETEVLSSGRLYEVVRAYDRLLRRWVAIKRLVRSIKHAPYLPLDRPDPGRSGLEREARLLCSLEQENIVAAVVWCDGRESARPPFLVLELAHGPSLQRLLEHRGPLSPGEVRTLLGHLARALDYLHERGLVHGDVKPANVLIHDGRVVWLVDFERAFPLELAARWAPVLPGTPPYSAPERACGGPISRCIDTYALGATALAALTGRLPGGAEGGATDGWRTALAEGLPDRAPHERLEAFFARALAKEPGERFQSPGALARCFAALFPAHLEEPFDVPLELVPSLGCPEAAAGSHPPVDIHRNRERDFQSRHPREARNEDNATFSTGCRAVAGIAGLPLDGASGSSLE